MFNPSFAKLLNKTFYKYIQPLLFYFWFVIQFKITRIIKEMHGTKSIDNNQFIVKNADKFLRRDILETYFCSRLPQLNWPLTLEELLGETCLPPPSVILFLTTLLKSLKHAVTDWIRRLVDSFVADAMHRLSGEITSITY